MNIEITENYQTDVKYALSAKVDNCWVEQVGFWRGGCLWAGEITLYNVDTETSKRISSTMCAPIDAEARAQYLVSLLVKHGIN